MDALQHIISNVLASIAYLLVDGFAFSALGKSLARSESNMHVRLLKLCLSKNPNRSFTWQLVVPCTLLFSRPQFFVAYYVQANICEVPLYISGELCMPRNSGVAKCVFWIQRSVGMQLAYFMDVDVSAGLQFVVGFLGWHRMKQQKCRDFGCADTGWMRLHDKKLLDPLRQAYLTPSWLCTLPRSWHECTTKVSHRMHFCLTCGNSEATACML